MNKKTELKRLEKQCTAIWRETVILRDGNFCGWTERDRHSGPVQVHHIFHKSHYGALRYNVLNGFPLCMACHCFNTKRTETEFLLWFQKNFPERFQSIESARNIFFHKDIQTMMSILDNLKNGLSEMKSNMEVNK